MKFEFNQLISIPYTYTYTGIYMYIYSLPQVNWDSLETGRQVDFCKYIGRIYYPFIHPAIYQSIIHPFTIPSIHQMIHPFMYHWSNHPPIHQCIHPINHPFKCDSSILPTNHPCIHSSNHLFTHLSFHSSIHSIHPSIHPSIPILPNIHAALFHLQFNFLTCPVSPIINP